MAKLFVSVLNLEFLQSLKISLNLSSETKVLNYLLDQQRSKKENGCNTLETDIQ